MHACAHGKSGNPPAPKRWECLLCLGAPCLKMLSIGKRPANGGFPLLRVADCLGFPMPPHPGRENPSLFGKLGTPRPRPAIEYCSLSAHCLLASPLHYAFCSSSFKEAYPIVPRAMSREERRFQGIKSSHPGDG